MSCAAALVVCLLAFVAGGCTRDPSAEQQAAWDAEIEALEERNAELTRRSAELAAADPEVARLPSGDVVIIVPTVFLDSLIRRVFRDVASRIEVTLTDLRVHKAMTVKKVVPVGDLVIDIEIHRVTARLAPGEPRIRFGENRAQLSLPVEVAHGEGDATVHLDWHGRNVAGAICGDLDVSERVSGAAVPAEYALAGALLLNASGSEVQATPSFPETKLNVRVAPSPESWAAIDAVIATKDGFCGWILEKVDVKKIVAQQVQEKGFDVKLPVEKIMPLRFPAGLRESVDVGGKTLSLEVSEGKLRIDEDAVRVGARVGIEADPG